MVKTARLENILASINTGQKTEAIAAKILLVPLELLKQNGFIVTEFLTRIMKTTGKEFGVFGSFKDTADTRVYLLLPLKNDFPVINWEIVNFVDPLNTVA